MAIIPSHFPILESVVRYQALGKLSDLANDISRTKRLNSDEALALRKQAEQIRLWLKALDASVYLTKEQRDKIKYALVDIADINDFGTAPVLSNVNRPSILIGSGVGTTTVNNTYVAGTPVIADDIDTGTENVFTLATSVGSGLLFHYKVTDGTASRSGILTVVWNTTTADCSDVSTPDINGNTSDLTLDVDVDSGNVRIRATALSNNWAVSGKYYLID
jgi:hypothetical protein